LESGSNLHAVRRERPILVFAVLLAALLGSSRATAGQTPTSLLPDLDQAAPSNISVVRAVRGGNTLYRLAFTSAVENRGRGDLIIVGHRPSHRVSRMTADQLVERVDAADRPVADARVHGVGRLRFVRLADHAHWHLIGFERYELRSAVTGRLVARDRKSGFCVGNRYTVIDGAPLTPRSGQFDENCGKNRPGLLTVAEGLSPGWADDYKANLEGQFIDITSVPAGRYLLVHRTNVDGDVREASRGNDSASALLSLRRLRGTLPRVTVLGICPDSATCS
jgi:Lysyl oxidase